MDQINENFIIIKTKIENIERLFKEKNLDDCKKLIQQTNDLASENLLLSKKVEQLVVKLTELEKKNGKNVELEKEVKALQDFKDANNLMAPKGEQQIETYDSHTKSEIKDESVKEIIKKVQSQEEKQKKKPKAEEKSVENVKLDISRLDFRVGKIVSAKKHPDADSLYVEEVNIGEDKNRIVVSGLVKFVPLEEMQNRMVVLLCNLKPAKMRGITSEAMVMCASTPEKVEILIPPDNCVPGERVIVKKYPGDPDSQLNPKKKIWETLAPSLKTNDELIATFKGEPLIVLGKGPIRAPSLKGVQIK